MTSTEAPDVPVETKLKELLKSKQLFSTEIDAKFHVENSPTLTLQLQTLQQAVSVRIEREGVLFACDIKNEQLAGDIFLRLYAPLKILYIREGYDELYDDIQRLWKTKQTYEVILNGNAGSGKSWYQLYVIRRLLRRALGTGEYENDDDDYDFIFRQVGHEMFLIDLKGCRGYNLTSWDLDTMTQLQRCLFFYEPGTQKELTPNHYNMPSLLTLSPYRTRISEYRKGPTLNLYFWPWSFTELKTMIDHSNEIEVESERIELDEFFEKYTYFGGIVRRHLEDSAKHQEARDELQSRLLHMDLKVLQSEAVNIDRDIRGDNVSGYILCFDGKREALEARRRDTGRTQQCYFNARVLNYASAFVEEKAEELLDKEPLESKMQVVLDRLNGRRYVDLSGKNLEAVATEFLRDGNVKWAVKRAGLGDWTGFQTKKRKVTREYDISGLLTKADELLVPTNTSFPVADMVFSGWNDNSVCVFQCTWQPTHPFTLRALYDLRVKKLHINATKKLVVIMVVPGQEQTYSEKSEDCFLEGSVNEPFLYKKNETVPAAALQAMWSNTEVHILRPMVDWKKLIREWLVSNHMETSIF